MIYHTLTTWEAPMTRNITHNEVQLRLRVQSRVEGADGIAVLELGDPSGADLPAWSPGAHCDLRLPGDLTRQYSLCGPREDRSVWRIGVLLEPQSRGGSTYIHDHLTPGTEVDVVGPRNNFGLVAAARYIFVAGGIGITPILP